MRPPIGSYRKDEVFEAGLPGSKATGKTADIMLARTGEA
jgi:hypothetical protein